MIETISVPHHHARILSQLAQVRVRPIPLTADSARFQPKFEKGVVVLPLFGWTEQRGNLQMLDQQLDKYLADNAVQKIIIEIDSFGGGLYGIQELADRIYEARKRKEIIAIANSVCAASAYWVGSQASKLYITPSGECGGVGVYEIHEDMSAALEKNGIKVTLISAGEYKTEGHPYGPLDKAAVKFIQDRLNGIQSKFIDAVARGRGVSAKTVKSNMGQGRVFGAKQAVKAGMADGVMSLNQLLKTGAKSATHQARNAKHLAFLR